jgi:soluble lytic murein transglycosylase-like protein
MNTNFLMAARAYSTLKGTLALVGVAALGALAVLPAPREVLMEHLPSIAALRFGTDPFGSATVSGPIQGGADNEREQRAVTEFIAKRYRVSEQAVAAYVAVAYRAGAKYSVDPMLILAVISIESRYNPVAESDMGAKGLMQVIPKHHLEKLSDQGGEQALLDPEVNIMVGTRILGEYKRRLADTEAALQMYAGAFDEPISQYANKVLAEKARLEAVRQKATKPETT